MISSPGCVCLGAVVPGASSTIVWMTSRPVTLRSTRIEQDGVLHNFPNYLVGGGRSRTPDLSLVRAALSQLSYPPVTAFTLPGARRGCQCE